MAVSGYGFWRRIAKYRKGRSLPRLSLARLKRAVVDMSSQRTIGKRDRYVGVAHFLVFWGFIVLLIGTTIIAIDEDIIAVLLDKPEWQFWHGAFYVGYSLVLDVFGIGFIVGLVMLARRRRQKPFRLDYGRVDRDDFDRSGYSLDDRVFLGILLFLGVSGFLIEGFRIIANDFPSFERVSIAGWTVGVLFSWMGESASDTARVATWWAHSGAALAFVAYLPFSKAMHIVVDALDLVFTDQGSARSLPAVADPAAPGYQTMASFTWKEYLDFDACTKCGRCHDVCPARTAGAPLSPRDLILDLREAADARAGIKLWYGGGAEPRHVGATEVAGAVIGTDTLWACTTCMACMETCPVGIEHVPTIVELRRRLVDVGDVEAGLQNAFQSLAPAERVSVAGARRQQLRQIRQTARSVDQGSRLHHQGPAQGAGRISVVRWRSGRFRPAGGGGFAHRRPATQPGRRRLRAALRGRAQLGQRCAPRRRGRPL
jgi:heterodisulfide reductase subunit C/nitrate reductase gamma subunit